MAKKNLLFFIHGIGRHPEGWIDEPDGPVATLDQALARYPECFPAGSKLRDFVDVVEVRYDDIFDDQIKRWSDQVKDLPTAGPGAGWVEGLQSFWAHANGDQKTFADFGGDVILYRGFDLLARSVRLRVNKIIVGEIFRHHKDSLASGATAPDIGIVAHSLGTAVAYDALNALFTSTWFAQGDELLSNDTLTDAQRRHFEEMFADIKDKDSPSNVPVRLDMLMMLSNTASLLTRCDANAVNALLQPGAATRCFFNVNHELDPVGQLRRYRIPSDWDPTFGVEITPRHLHQENVHAMSHYLSHPAVHGRVFARMIGKERGFKASCQTAALKTLPQQPEWIGVGGALKGKAEAEIARLRQKLQEVIGIVDDNDVFGLVKRYDAFAQRILGGVA